MVLKQRERERVSNWVAELKPKIPNKNESYKNISTVIITHTLTYTLTLTYYFYSLW